MFCKVVFCRVCGFRVRVWESYRTYRSSGYGYESVTALTEVPGIAAQAYRTHRSFRAHYRKVVPVPRVLLHRRTELTEDPGTSMNVMQNLQKFRVRVRKCYRTHRSSGYCGKSVQNSQKFRVGMKMLCPYPGYCGTGVTEFTEVLCRVIPGKNTPGMVLYVPYRTQQHCKEVSGTVMNVVQNSRKFRVRVIPG